MHTLKSSTSEFTDPASQITNHTFSAPITLVYTQRVKGPSTSKPPLVHPLHAALTPDLNPSIQWRQVSSIEVECKSIDTLQVSSPTPTPPLILTILTI